MLARLINLIFDLKTVLTLWEFIKSAYNIFFAQFTLSQKYDQRFNSRKEEFFARAQNHLAHDFFT